MDKREKARSEDRRGRLVRDGKLVLILSLALAFPALKLLDFIGPLARPSMHLSLTAWEVVFAELVESPNGAALLIKMDNEPPGWGRPWERLLSLDPASGRVRGQLVKGDATYLIGLTRQELWLSSPGKEDLGVAGYALPNLELVFDQGDLFAAQPDLGAKVKEIEADGMQGDLRVYALDGYAYRLQPRSGEVDRLPLDPPPLAPTLLDRERCSSNRGPLRDFRTCQPINVAGDTVHVDVDDAFGVSQLRFERRAPDGATHWVLVERALWGARDADEPVRRLLYVAEFDGLIVLVAEDGSGQDDVYAAAIDAAQGQVAWAKTFW